MKDADASLDIDALHRALFGHVPAKHGTAYERVAAIVLASLGWGDVVHDLRERPPGKRARHQLDITATAPSGNVKRLLVECKDMTRVVGQGIVNTLVGVRDQVGADVAAIMTREGFTQGAIDVAVDEQIALIHLDAYDPLKHGTNFAKRISVTFTALAPPVYSDFDVVLIDTSGERGAVSISVTGDDHLLHADGSPAERIETLLSSQLSRPQEGEFRRRISLPEGRFIETVDGPPIEIRSLSWTETNHGTSFEMVHEATGTPVLLLQQLDGEGGFSESRLLISEDLFAWNIDEKNEVVPRGPLLAAPAHPI